MSKITSKIDRLSNSKLQLGLKNANAYFSSTADSITTGVGHFALSAYTIDSAASAFNNSDVLPKDVVAKLIDSAKADVFSYLKSTYIVQGAGIVVTPGTDPSDATKPTITIGLNALYGGETQFKDGSNSTADTSSTMKVITGIIADQYGRITSVVTKQLKLSDISTTDSTTHFDNYKAWKVGVNNTDTAINSGTVLNLVAGDGLTAALTQDAKTSASEANSENQGNDIGGEYSIKFQIATSGPIIIDDDKKVTLASSDGWSSSADLYKVAVDKYGRVTSTSKVTGSDLPAFSDSSNGVVNYNHSGYTETAAASSTYFLTSSNKWATIPFDKVKIESASSSEKYQLLGSASYGEGKIPYLAPTGVYFSGVGSASTLYAPKFSGNGYNLTNINIESVVVPNSSLKPIWDSSAGKIRSDYIPAIAADDLSIDFAAYSILASDGTGKSLTSVSNPTGTGDYVLAKRLTGDAASQAAQWVSIDDLLASGVRFMGTITKDGGTGSISAEEFGALANIKQGDMYKISSAVANGESGFDLAIGSTGTIHVDNGDTLIATSSSKANSKDIWSVLQSNLNDDTIVYKGSSVSGGTLAAFGDSGTTIGTLQIRAAEDSTLGGTTLSGTGGNLINITGNAGTASKLKGAITLWGQSFDGSSNVDGQLTGVTDITASGMITALNFVGDLAGTAEKADKLSHALKLSVGSEAAKEFDGSSDVTFEVTAANVGAISDVTLETSGGSSGNVLADVAITSDGTSRKITKSFASALTKVSSTDFTVGTANSTAPTINLKTSSANGALSLLDATSLAATSGSSKLLNFGGHASASQFYATNLYGQASGAIQVAQTMPTSATLSGVDETSNYYSDKLRILVARNAGKSNAGALDSYTFIDSGISITDSGTDRSSTTVPTSAAMADAIETAISAGVNCLTLNSTGKTVSGNLPALTRIDHIDMYYKAGFTSATFSVSIGAKDLVSTSDTDASESDSLYTFKLNQIPSITNQTISLKSATDVADATGDVTAYIYYSK